jgi:hypothetical protein
MLLPFPAGSGAGGALVAALVLLSVVFATALWVYMDAEATAGRAVVRLFVRWTRFNSGRRRPGSLPASCSASCSFRCTSTAAAGLSKHPQGRASHQPLGFLRNLSTTPPASVRVLRLVAPVGLVRCRHQQILPIRLTLSWDADQREHSRSVEFASRWRRHRADPPEPVPAGSLVPARLSLPNSLCLTARPSPSAAGLSHRQRRPRHG